MHGVPPVYLNDLDLLLQDPHGFVHRGLAECAEGRLVSLPVSDRSGMADSAWMGFLRESGVVSIALLPLLCEGRLVGLVGLHFQGLSHLGETPLKFLQGAVRDIEHALDSLAAHERCLRAGQQASLTEHRFRCMVEQAVSSIFVRREGRFIYVNPRFCDLVGWPAEELLGQETLRFITEDPVGLQAIRTAWACLDSGEQCSVSYAAPVRLKNGTLVELWLECTRITWDDGLEAVIVMVRDITDRKRADEKIAGYVKQLEGSMKATLQAVSSMVEMRDLYTAGHERRVGLIARAIGQAVGWDETRCETLELAGLVHDIGKIAVPTDSHQACAPEYTGDGLMRGHAEAGYQILKDVPFAAPIAEMIRQHYERLGGSGYPRGLKGEEILPEVRVLTVADILELISAHRPCRAASASTSR